MESRQLYSKMLPNSLFEKLKELLEKYDPVSFLKIVLEKGKLPAPNYVFTNNKSPYSCLCRFGEDFESEEVERTKKDAKSKK